MKIIAWNCNMAFRNKVNNILALIPDILIVPECENINFKERCPEISDHLWFGEVQNKGLAVFSFNGFKIKLLESHNPDFKYILPLEIFNGKIHLFVFAVWTQKPLKHSNYTEQIWNTVNFYSEYLNYQNVILAGDFNSNSIWDKPNRNFNHTNHVNILKSKNIVSAYHHYYQQQHGKETDNTFFMYRKLKFPFHIDYCFASGNLIEKLKAVEVGSYELWIKYSDHTPIIVEFEL